MNTTDTTLVVVLDRLLNRYLRMGKTPRRIVAATLLTIFATQTFAPGICYALTSGPTQPEANSFEPVDTTDMINLQSGDFTNNIPMLDVPGPDGDYPLSLSYHAGVHTIEMPAGWGWLLEILKVAHAVT